MRILVASDLHYRLRQFDWLLSAAPRFDAVVLAGDHLDVASEVPASVQVAALAATLGALAARVPLLVCSGNHDLTARNVAGEKTAGWLAPLRGSQLFVDGDTVLLRHTLFTICPWWDGAVAQAEVEAQLEAAARRRGEAARWVWVYHAPPPGALSWTGKRHYGDDLLAALVQRHAPDVVLCGHIHEAPFKPQGGWAERSGSTWLFNAGRQPGDLPTHLDIDLAAGRARWISMEGVEERDLAVQ